MVRAGWFALLILRAGSFLGEVCDVYRWWRPARGRLACIIVSHMRDRKVKGGGDSWISFLLVLRSDGDEDMASAAVQNPCSY